MSWKNHVCILWGMSACSFVNLKMTVTDLNYISNQSSIRKSIPGLQIRLYKIGPNSMFIFYKEDLGMLFTLFSPLFPLLVITIPYKSIPVLLSQEGSTPNTRWDYTLTSHSIVKIWYNSWKVCCMYFVCQVPDLCWLVVVKGDGTSKNRGLTGFCHHSAVKYDQGGDQNNFWLSQSLLLTHHNLKLSL